MHEPHEKNKHSHDERSNRESIRQLVLAGRDQAEQGKLADASDVFERLAKRAHEIVKRANQ